MNKKKCVSTYFLLQVTDIVSRSALIQLSPPECDEEYDIDTTKLCYELMLFEKSRDGKYKLVYR